MRTKIIENLKFLSLSIALGIILGAGIVAVSAWTEPTGNAPEGNLGAPVNTSAISQIKSGGLQVNGFRNLGTTALDGNVGVGITDPAYKLDVVGGIHSTTNLFVDQDATVKGTVNAAKASISGNVGIGTAPSIYTLDVNGGIHVKNNINIDQQVRAASAKISGLVNCNTIDTDANGNLKCGTDATGSAPDSSRINFGSCSEHSLRAANGGSPPSEYACGANQVVTNMRFSAMEIDSDNVKTFTISVTCCSVTQN